MESNEKKCLNCQNLSIDSLRQHFCVLTKLPVETSDTCDNFKGIEKPELKRKKNTLLVPILIFLGFCLIAFVRYANKVIYVKEVKKQIELVEATQLAQIYLYKYSEAEDTLGLKRFKGAFFTYDTTNPEIRFVNTVRNSLYKLPETINNFDTVFVENFLFVIHSDSSMTLKTKLNGYSITAYNSNNRWFEERK